MILCTFCSNIGKETIHKKLCLPHFFFFLGVCVCSVLLVYIKISKLLSCCMINKGQDFYYVTKMSISLKIL